jgi:hypothetical protein
MIFLKYKIIFKEAGLKCPAFLFYGLFFAIQIFD